MFRKKRRGEARTTLCAAHPRGERPPAGTAAAAERLNGAGAAAMDTDPATIFASLYIRAARVDFMALAAACRRHTPPAPARLLPPSFLALAAAPSRGCGLPQRLNLLQRLALCLWHYGVDNNDSTHANGGKRKVGGCSRGVGWGARRGGLEVRGERRQVRAEVRMRGGVQGPIPDASAQHSPTSRAELPHEPPQVLPSRPAFSQPLARPTPTRWQATPAPPACPQVS